MQQGVSLRVTRSSPSLVTDVTVREPPAEVAYTPEGQSLGTNLNVVFTNYVEPQLKTHTHT